MKEYKSNEDLIDYLISKGVIIRNKKDALRKIEKYTYYAIVNTYKEVFKDDGNYLDGVTFNEIYSLYDFDKNLKSIFLKYALEIEVTVKSLIANTISKKYGIKNYLNRQTFDMNIDTESVKRLVYSIVEEINKNYGKHPAITHYQDVYGYIPPFVLVKVLTLGEISRFYGLLKQEDRQAISKYFKISDKLLKQVLVNLTLARNISAHSDRLYTFHSKFFISYKVIDKTYNRHNSSTNFYMLVNCMKLLLDEKQSKEFQKLIDKEIKKLSKKLKSIDIRNILDIMGYPSA